MATVSRTLPAQPHLDIPKREARALLDEWRERRPEALERIRRRHPKFRNVSETAPAAAAFKLADAQLVVAREYGFATWAELKQRIGAAGVAGALLIAIQAGDREQVVAILRAHPELLHLPVRSASWGPPMSHAATLGSLEMVEACAQLGARDFQHAFERAVMQGQLECARWLHAHGGQLVPGIVMSPCETLNVTGLRFLLELGAPLTDAQGSRLAPLAHAFETYSRNPAGKHAILALFAEQGIELPDTAPMALHRGDIARLDALLQRDPELLRRRFGLREIYPAECGCGQEGRQGMHGTPIDGTTLLHLAIDFHEREIFEWLLARGADVNARAATDAEGFGGQTPLFHTVILGPADDGFMARELLARGAARDARASLRKFIDWCEEPRWHVARNVTAAEWASGFPDRSWVTHAAAELLQRDGDAGAGGG
jgi:hypothetical protein